MRRPGFGRDLQQIAAALVGTVAATQVIAPSTATSSDDVTQDLGAQAHEHTYQAPEGTPQRATLPSPFQIEVVGANGRRLIAHRGQDGRVWIGGCEFDDMRELGRLADWLTEWADC